jgi:hypothetical protein
MREELRAQGKEEPPREISEVSDRNVITPGTEFMEKVSEALEYYIRARFNSDPWWRDITVCSCALINAIYVFFLFLKESSCPFQLQPFDMHAESNCMVYKILTNIYLLSNLTKWMLLISLIHLF